MVLRVEYILLISLGILSFFIFTEKPHNIKAIESNCSREALFRDFYLVEINQEGIKNALRATEAIKYKNSFQATDINITHNRIYHLFAQKAIYEKNIVSIENNITLKKDNSMEFKTDTLTFKIKEEVAYTDSGFIMNINGSKIKGTHLKYNLKIGEVSADKIKATLLTDTI